MVLHSRRFVPAGLGSAEDRRVLGVAVRRLAVDGRALPAAAFGSGWHAAEAGWRWTDGAATAALPRGGGVELTVTLEPIAARYWHQGPGGPGIRRPSKQTLRLRSL